ncbi:outer membrane lipid asymmetry maintenance protein MlaD [Henriciella aquimarina]|uniref:outer membrane lipid asymmetry maintenance protein MlaD n=1 Tax=Henriciella aquimarina TaxID=545261 RepID=UPI000A066B69|nr:outer membrane lipid asymmetry maintenance protein MlaD [Henriciella aquimarina]
MRESIFETLVGAVVLGVAGVFLWFALARGGEAGTSPSDSVEIGARFNSVSGIERGTDVRLAGVKIGTVRNISLDVERAEALVTMAISKDLMPLDDGTSARIQTEGLLGGNYINLEPAAGFGTIEPCPEGEELFGETGCGEIMYTQGSVDLLTLFASFANGGGDGSGDSSSGSSAASSGSAGGASAASEPAANSGTETEAPASGNDSAPADGAESDTESTDSSTSFGEPYPDTAAPGDDQ